MNNVKFYTGLLLKAVSYLSLAFLLFTLNARIVRNWIMFYTGSTAVLILVTIEYFSYLVDLCNEKREIMKMRDEEKRGEENDE